MLCRSAGADPNHAPRRDPEGGRGIRKATNRDRPSEYASDLARPFKFVASGQPLGDGRLRLGMGGRLPSERVAALRRNQWPDWIGYAVALKVLGSFRWIVADVDD
jgi:hypothetical protein